MSNAYRTTNSTYYNSQGNITTQMTTRDRYQSTTAYNAFYPIIELKYSLTHFKKAKQILN
jgi:hypothetical protein